MTAQRPLRIAVLVVSYGSHDLVDVNLGRTAVPDGTIVVVVDNFTTTAERATMTRLCEARGWTLVAPEVNLGFGGGMNAAAEAAIERGASALVLLNPDAYLVGDGVSRLGERVAADPAAQVSPLVVRPDGRHFASLMEVDLARGRLRRTVPGRRYEHSAPWVSGACFAMGSGMWQRLGGFDDDYFLYWEDVDLSVRVQEAGGTVIVDETITAVHDPGGTQAQDTGRKSPLYFFYNTRNRLVFAAKHADARRGAWVLGSPAAARNVLRRGSRRQLLHPRESIWSVLRGTAAGLRFLTRRPPGGGTG